ncbi:AbiV family abortive infection protein [Phycicoccus sp. Soil802]|uniref:AbiV family abortive infection protein n=1 Tax=Phycicoccus sp. Soil802 TaxID=1736414 RepID=UPI0007028DBA|nr:AbiV family abortive infection protein [Phycicoccus sp. Soil802]KRF29468.1 hypothetical protein ASG91_00065 [Phycicoccus sp. Soil802]
MRFAQRHREHAKSWKSHTKALPDQARADAPYVIKDGSASGADRPFCLPLAFAAHNLLPNVREQALALFAQLQIPWHAGVDEGPSNHLLSSQVQCVNALTSMVDDPNRVHLAFGDLLPIAEVLEIEPERFLTFEFIGDTDYFNESPRGPRRRGAHCTSVDAAFTYRTPAGEQELALVEWKFTETYGRRRPQPDQDRTRAARYGASLLDPAGPVRSHLLPFVDLLQEPLYQLMRQQLLAYELERDPSTLYDTVRVIHVSPAENAELRGSVHGRARKIGATVDLVWARLLVHHDRFVSVDSSRFLDPSITSEEYAYRYALPVAEAAIPEPAMSRRDGTHFVGSGDSAPTPEEHLARAQVAAQLARALVENAGHLIGEAQLLRSNGGSPRAYALAALACEELAKVYPCIDSLNIGAALPVRGNSSWSDHAEKLITLASLHHAFLEDLDKVDPSRLTPWATQVHATKLAAFYVDHKNGSVTAPEATDLAATDALIELAQRCHALLLTVVAPLTAQAVVEYVAAAPVLESLLSGLPADPGDIPGSLGALRNLLSVAREVNDQMSADDVVGLLTQALLPVVEGTTPHRAEADPVGT